MSAERTQATLDADAALQARVAEIDERLRLAYQADKLGAVARLAAGLAHEINNPLAFMRSNLATLGNYLERVAHLRDRLAEAPAAWRELEMDFVAEDGRELVRDCIAGSDRIARLVRDLKGFSNVDKPGEQIADVNDCLRAAAALVAAAKPVNVLLELDLQRLPPILCLPGHLNQVFFNLIENAIQASGEQGQVTVASSAEKDAVVICISDHGEGIPAEALSKVFEPFYTTRAVGVGTGLGLTVARDIVLAHDGDIGIDSRPGQGTTVVVRLPA